MCIYRKIRTYTHTHIYIPHEKHIGLTPALAESKAFHTSLSYTTPHQESPRPRLAEARPQYPTWSKLIEAMANHHQ